MSNEEIQRIMSRRSMPYHASKAADDFQKQGKTTDKKAKKKGDSSNTNGGGQGAAESNIPAPRIDNIK